MSNVKEEEFDPENDLPLMSNTRDVLVYHYILDLTCHLENEFMKGCIVMFLDPKPSHCDNQQVFSTHQYQSLLEKHSQSTQHSLENSSDNCSSHFILTLDAYMLNICKVSEVILTVTEVGKLEALKGQDVLDTQDCYLSYLNKETQDLSFEVDTWSLKIRKNGVANAFDFPRIIKICYSTRPEGKSLRWAKDQDGKLV